MSNDLGNQRPGPPRPAVPQTNPGCAAGAFTGICIVLILIGVMITAIGAGGVGLVWTIVAVIILVNGQKQFRKAQRQTSGAAPRPAGSPRPGPEAACPNPEPHRHFETPAPAAPRRRDPPAQQRSYHTFVQPAGRWPTAAEKRLENMKHLYQAGLLTREEYDAEVRRIRREMQ